MFLSYQPRPGLKAHTSIDVLRSSATNSAQFSNYQTRMALAHLRLLRPCDFEHKVVHFGLVFIFDSWIPEAPP